MIINDSTLFRGKALTMGHEFLHTHTTDNLRMFVLDVLRHDEIEQLENVLNMLNNQGCIGWREFWPHDFIADEVGPVLMQLAEDGLLDAAIYPDGKTQKDLSRAELREFSPHFEGVWFHLNDRGWKVWDSWSPPVSDT